MPANRDPPVRSGGCSPGGLRLANRQRLGSKTANFRIPENLPPGPLQELLPLRVLRVDRLPRFAPRSLQWNGESYAAETWVEQVASDLEPVARFEDGHGALFSHERFLYLAGLPDDRWLEDLIKMVASKQTSRSWSFRRVYEPGGSALCAASSTTIRSRSSFQRWKASTSWSAVRICRRRAY